VADEVATDVKTSGIVCIDVGTVVLSGTALREPPVIGVGCQIGPRCHIGQHTMIGDATTIQAAKVESPIIMMQFENPSQKLTQYDDIIENA